MCNDINQTLKDEVRCKHSFTIHSADGFMVVRYKDADTGEYLVACGSNLPTASDIIYTLHGKWGMSKNGKYGRQFEVSYFDMEQPKGKAAIVSYFCSLKCGIGKVVSGRIYAKWGDGVWNVLESDPSQLKAVNGVTDKIVTKLMTRLKETEFQRKIIAKLGDAAAAITPKMLNDLVRYCNKNELDPLDTVEHHTYSLMQVRGFGFETVDRLARALPDFDPARSARLIASLAYIFEQKSMEGHVCVPKDELLGEMTKVLNAGFHNAVSEDSCKEALNLAYKMKAIKVTANMVYSTKSFEEETGIVKDIRRIMSASDSKITEIDTFIEEYEDANFKLADSQRDAVHGVFEHQVEIITGGPGTGKTTVTKAVLYVHQQVFGGDSNAVLLAPTGRAARRMSEATGFPAQTIHSAIGYTGVPELDNRNEGFLEGNLFIIDESSMMDQFIAAKLLSMIPDGAKVVFVGDPDQLPSVGAGNVLREMIRSKAVPTTRLSVIFRQAQDNPIVGNSLKINQGCTNLTFTNTFCFIERSAPEEILRTACAFYVKAVKKFGLENVILLNPFRNKGMLSVNEFNRQLQNLINPPIEGEESIKIRKLEFRPRDLVMQTKNTEIAMNGDIGVIHEISKMPDPDDMNRWTYIASIEFNGDGKRHDYTPEMMQDLDLAYCTTVHKSQGSEYQTVIMVVSEEHKVMLKRNIIYTGVTRAKQNVALIGQTEALNTAILNNQTDVRHTLLGDRLHAAFTVIS